MHHSVHKLTKVRYFFSHLICENSCIFIKDFQQNPFNGSGVQRLSPQQQQINQQILHNFQQTNNSNSNSSQLSPRQPPFTQQSTTQAQPNTAWNQQSVPNSTNVRLNIQQNNPMLNAQLSVSSILIS